jgi:methanogenic corrinoid protein MtbC1
VCVTLALLASCGMSKETVERRVASEFQQRLDKDADTARCGMEVRSVSLIKSGSAAYKGYITVTLDGETHDIGITVTTDASNILLETDPFAFSFLTEKSLEELFNW